MFRIIRKSIFVCLLPLVVVAVVLGDSIRMQVQSAGARGEIARFKSALQDHEGLDRTLQAHYVRLNDENRLTGQITAFTREEGITTGVGNLEVNLVRNSQVVTRTMTEFDGTFLTPQVLPGTYTLCVSGDDGFLAYGIRVISRQLNPQEVLPVPLPGDVDLIAPESDPDTDPDTEEDTANLGTSRYSTVVWNAAAANQNEPEGQVQLTAAVIPPAFSALQRIMSNYVPEGIGVSMGNSDASRINVEESIVVGGFRVSLTPEGNLEGRIASLTDDEDEPIRLREMNAFLLLNDEIYSRVSVQEDGNFLFNEIEPGVYGFAAAGPDGFAAMSFQAVQADEEDTSTSTGSESPFRNTAAIAANHKRASKDLQVAIAPREDLDWLRNKIDDLNREDPPIDPIAAVPPGPMPGGGNFGGGGGGYGGGGGGTGLGGFGDLIGAGLAAWIVSEAVKNDDNNLVTTPPIVIPPVVSPNQVSDQQSQFP